MSRRSLSFPVPPSLAIAEGATTPSGGTAGALVWSTTTGGLMAWSGSAWRSVARSRMEINAQTGTTYTLVAADARDRITTLANAAGITVTVPPSVFSGGDLVPLLSAGAGQVTIAPGSGMAPRTPLTAKSRVQWSQLSIFFLSATEYVVGGDMAAT